MSTTHEIYYWMREICIRYEAIESARRHLLDVHVHNDTAWCSDGYRIYAVPMSLINIQRWYEAHASVFPADIPVPPAHTPRLPCGVMDIGDRSITPPWLDADFEAYSTHYFPSLHGALYRARRQPVDELINLAGYDVRVGYVEQAITLSDFIMSPITISVLDQQYSPVRLSIPNGITAYIIATPFEEAT